MQLPFQIQIGSKESIGGRGLQNQWVHIQLSFSFPCFYLCWLILIESLFLTLIYSMSGFHSLAGTVVNYGYTPQHKPAQDVMKKYYSS
jgi:hypothetical protein